MKMLDSENTRLGRELVELQGRLALGERAEKEGRREALGLRQKLLNSPSPLQGFLLCGEENGDFSLCEEVFAPISS